ncbi:hypothetical protein Tco_1091619 [Tanacetum coccineum]|uniref:Uncharacterized protein n=1 Tax=Tanacetum coccineum TaxID=301880 RepID=A0ABQ5I8Q4_9ASTR
MWRLVELQRASKGGDGGAFICLVAKGGDGGACKVCTLLDTGVRSHLSTVSYVLRVSLHFTVVVIIVTVVIVVVTVILVVVVAIIGVVIVVTIIEHRALLPDPLTFGLCLRAILIGQEPFNSVQAILSACSIPIGLALEFHQDKASSVRVPVANFTLQSSEFSLYPVFLFAWIVLSTCQLVAACASKAANHVSAYELPDAVLSFLGFVGSTSQLVCGMIHNELSNSAKIDLSKGWSGGVVDLTGDEDPTDEDSQKLIRGLVHTYIATLIQILTECP